MMRFLAGFMWFLCAVSVALIIVGLASDLPWTTVLHSVANAGIAGAVALLIQRDLRRRSDAK